MKKGVGYARHRTFRAGRAPRWIFYDRVGKERLAVAASERPTGKENDAQKNMNNVIYLAEH